MIYKKGLSSVGKILLKTTTLANQMALWPAQTFGHPRNMFLDSVKQSSSISKISCYILFSSHVLKRDSHSAVDLGKALFPIFALALNLPEHFFGDKVCRVFSSNDINDICVSYTLTTDSTFSGFNETSSLSSSNRPNRRTNNWYWRPHGVRFSILYIILFLT